MAKIIGLTGGIASGKSTVSNLLRRKGFAIVDADIAARKVVEIGKDAYKQIVEAFGPEILQQDQNLDRKKLGTIVFHDEEKRLMLNQIVHPAVREYMQKEKETALKQGKETVIMDIPLLFESNLGFMVDQTILVYVEQSIQLQRLMDRNQFTEAEAMARIQSQMPLEEKIEKSDAVINNNGTIDETEQQLNEIITKWFLKP
ncbi:dephospho-CoA kinase [Heyndrickxia oleronia]|jgi:dephospho-CoA kinase|uniref:dephospho-CoA kinase n=1 Tax=Heyndrickxia oleronia TaxID=38875 RepID=UPI00243182AA|nr:dephospho-CoA kinase [Heyndrickxia oleronia]MCI1590157.1 dephospho-CoA kinase [Heyndrickxia oleronia]MCI1613191.1 dephospho-CoA kinase [Heyndrickxia oleronia]MCI1744518.1 dephospho-CoA kinase [Heyndrickxia oleronia]MCI1761141.1 dephospho-CoA kinase [Heyndrickxia oleronia]